MNKKVVLVTGASSGIGKSAAQMLNKEGYTVYGAARRVEKMKDLENQGINVLYLDLTDEGSISNCVNSIIKKEKRIDILVNNAGYANFGTIEETPQHIGRVHYEVNVFGLARIAQLIIPYMRKNKYGKIVNVSSVGGKIAGPFGGWYQSSKFALEAMSDVMRMELKQFGIDVIVIEPGAIKTEMAKELGKSVLKNSGNGVYKKSAEKFAHVLNSMFDNATSPEDIAKTIVKSIKVKNPQARYVKGKNAKLFLFVRQFLPDKYLDKIIMRQFF